MKITEKNTLKQDKSVPRWKSIVRLNWFGIRGKLITVFLILKVVPLLVMGFVVWGSLSYLEKNTIKKVTELSNDLKETIVDVGDRAIVSSVNELDNHSRESIERLSTDTARAVAQFLYDRDYDILQAANLTPEEESYQKFIFSRKRGVSSHGEWQLHPDGSKWMAVESADKSNQVVVAKSEKNKKEFHSRPGELNRIKILPLYLEMTFVDTKGMEQVKLTSLTGVKKSCSDISQKENTWCKAEPYFEELKKLQAGQIYVSEVIGPYIPSKIIGAYTPGAAKKRGIPYRPQAAGYAGKENPVGKRFRGIVRWATPVVEKGVIIGYVTLALDHTHIMEFTDHIIPTGERYSSIPDASSGNYAFMWDHLGRNISHPRDYFIVGYDPESGEPEIPWLEERLYKQWQASDLSIEDFLEQTPTFQSQGDGNKPSKELMAQGLVGLDGRFLNFAPQCVGWMNLTQHGGSGSFVIFWSKLWKLTTAATIPYYTGQYGRTARGFGFVTIGANIDAFHQPALETEEKLAVIIKNKTEQAALQQEDLISLISSSLMETIQKIIIFTLIMIFLVVFIAFWMASSLSKHLTMMIAGLQNFRDGDMKYRLPISSNDEMGELAHSFNVMAENIEINFKDLEKKSLENKVLLKKLSSEVEEKSKTEELLRKAKDVAEYSNHAKSEFLANMSHEIRTPMNGIVGMTSLVLGTELNLDQQKYIENIKLSTDGLLSLLNDILDFSKIEAGQLVMEKNNFNLVSMLDNIISLMGHAAKEKGLELILQKDGLDFPVFVEGDELRLRQILVNLIGNGIKFTEKGSVMLRFIPEEREDYKVGLHFIVSDTGIGIPEGKQEIIFSSFKQVDSSTTRKFGGTGLGLAICKQLVEMMGGRIWYESAVGKGSQFHFIVVFERGKEEKVKQHQPTISSAVNGLAVLLVDDNKINRSLAGIVLEQDSHRIFEAENGLDGLAVLLEEDIDLILMDVQMPVMDGLTASTIIRASENGNDLSRFNLPQAFPDKLIRQCKGRHIPIVAMTANAMRGDQEKCLAAGMDNYLTKPFEPVQLRSIISDVVRSTPE